MYFKYKINFSNGESQIVDSLAQADKIIKLKYPKSCYCLNGELSDFTTHLEINEVGRALVWADKEKTENDSGLNAIAEIRII